MILETARLVLRPWYEDDAENLFLYARNDSVGPAADWTPHKSVEESREIIRTVFADENVFAVALRSDGRATGCAGVLHGADAGLLLGDREGEIGYWLGVPFWGRGIITEAVREFVRYSFECLGLTALWCRNFEENVRSRRVQEKCGFHYQHTTDRKLCALTNETRAERITRLTREEWCGM